MNYFCLAHLKNRLHMHKVKKKNQKEKIGKYEKF